jgi:hypothetical protein
VRAPCACRTVPLHGAVILLRLPCSTKGCNWQAAQSLCHAAQNSATAQSGPVRCLRASCAQPTCARIGIRTIRSAAPCSTTAQLSIVAEVFPEAVVGQGLCQGF